MSKSINKKMFNSYATNLMRPSSLHGVIVSRILNIIQDPLAEEVLSGSPKSLNEIDARRFVANRWDYVTIDQLVDWLSMQKFDRKFSYKLAKSIFVEICKYDTGKKVLLRSGESAESIDNVRYGEYSACDLTSVLEVVGKLEGFDPEPVIMNLLNDILPKKLKEIK